MTDHVTDFFRVGRCAATWEVAEVTCSLQLSSHRSHRNRLSIDFFTVMFRHDNFMQHSGQSWNANFNWPIVIASRGQWQRMANGHQYLHCLARLDLRGAIALRSRCQLSAALLQQERKVRKITKTINVLHVKKSPCFVCHVLVPCEILLPFFHEICSWIFHGWLQIWTCQGELKRWPKPRMLTEKWWTIATSTARLWVASFKSFQL